MGTIVEKLRLFVSGKKEKPDPSSLDFVKTHKGILREILLSRESGNLLGIYCKALGQGMFLTYVEDIERFGKEEIVLLGQYDASGQLLSRRRVSLEEIYMVCPFHKPYKNPPLSVKTSQIAWP